MDEEIENKTNSSENSLPVSNNENIDKEMVDNSEEEEIILGDLSNLSTEDRNQLFEKGLEYEKRDLTKYALQYYLASLTGLSKDSQFVLLPQCLRNIADIYFKQEEYEKAILFIQAEKLYYENALVDTTEIQTALAKLQENKDDDNIIDENSVRADEYENLAKLCMDQRQPYLALEYAGKATKIRQQLFGNDHKITRESLDYFATLYAEVGRQQYSDSMTSLSSDLSDSKENLSPNSILRQRRKKHSVDSLDDKEKKSVHFGEPLVTKQLIYDDNLPRSFTVLTILFGLIATIILGTWLFCVMRNDHVCQSFTKELRYMYTQLRYMLYKNTGNRVFKH